MQQRSFDEIQAKLQFLRPVLLSERARPFLKMFDEFIQQREFELALHSICDFILEQETPSVNAPIIEAVEYLHTAMGLEDQCVQELQKLKVS